MKEIMLPLKNAMAAAGLECDDKKLEMFYEYMKRILEWNEKINLTAIRDESEFVIKHFADSVMCAQKIAAPGVRRIVDIGTGAGFPGIPLAIVFPDREFVLVDSVHKKLKVVESVAAELKITNVRVVHGRAEDIGSDIKFREKFDFCVSRAVASLAVLAEYCLPLVRVGGCFAAYKGNDIEEELRSAVKAIGVLGGKVSEIQPFLTDDTDLGHKIIYIEKISKTPQKYPRKAGKPLKEPI